LERRKSLFYASHEKNSIFHQNFVYKNRMSECALDFISDSLNMYLYNGCITPIRQSGFFVTILATVDLYVYENRNYFQNFKK
jgi:hypothetical protein